MELFKKLQKCRQEIKSTKLKKEGHNKFSNYDYFTPSQVEKLVFDSCNKNNLFTKFDLIRTELGLLGQLIIVDIDNPEDKLLFTMATDIPEIKATNISQQLGGAMTYTERYLKMTAFGIEDNSLDFDSHDNRKNPEKKEQVTEWLTEEQFNKALNSDIKGIQATLKTYSYNNGKAMKKEYKTSLESKLNQLKG
jgi:hypothetical protein